MVAFDDVVDGCTMPVGVSGSGVGDIVDDSTELGLLKAACVIESSGVSKKFRSNSCDSNFTSVMSSTTDGSGSSMVELMLDESMWNTSMIIVALLNGTKITSRSFKSLHSVLFLSFNYRVHLAGFTGGPVICLHGSLTLSTAYRK